MPERVYTQVARAEATDRTRRSLLDAAVALFERDRNFDFPLEEIAERAGISSRTLLRHFGSKEGLIETAIADAEDRVARSREAPPGDLATAIPRLVDHYEEMGDDVMRMLAEAERSPAVKRITENGSRMHERWVEQIFEPDLSQVEGRRRAGRKALLATVTDVYVWALLRRRQGLSRGETESAISALVEQARGATR